MYLLLFDQFLKIVFRQMPPWGGRGLAKVSRDIFFQNSKAYFCHITPGGFSPVALNDRWGTGVSKKGYKSFTYYLNGPLEIFGDKLNTR